MKTIFLLDWIFAGHKILAKVKTNDMYHKLIGMHAWMVEQVSKEWKSQDPIGGGKVQFKWGAISSFFQSLGT